MDNMVFSLSLIKDTTKAITVKAISIIVDINLPPREYFDASDEKSLKIQLLSLALGKNKEFLHLHYIV